MAWAAAPILSFSLIFLSHLICRSMKLVLRKKSKISLAEQQLTSDIKDLIRQANSLTTPSTFAKAAKIKRIAAVKEKELYQLRKGQRKGQQWLLSWQSLLPDGFKVVAHLVLVYWFWQHPVSIVSSKYIYPFDKALTWKSHSSENDGFAHIGILPWLFVCSKVCAFLTKRIDPMKLN